LTRDAMSDSTVSVRGDGLTVHWHLQTGINAVAKRSLLRDLAETTAPASGLDAAR
jgi:hypothetical protein